MPSGSQARRTLVLARDRYGVKPLYYAPLPDGGLVVRLGDQSHPGKRAACRACPRPKVCSSTFAFQNLAATANDVRRHLPAGAGHPLIWRRGPAHARRYWDLVFPRSRRDTDSDLTDQHRDILQRAIRRQLAADVPVKTYLSGGIDSTAITVISYQNDPSVTAYSCIFDLDDVGDDRMVDEREFSRLVARSTACGASRCSCGQSTSGTAWPTTCRAMEDLRMGMGYPVYYMARRVALDAKVVLSGTGGDEFHAGYVSRFAAVVPDRLGAGPRTLRQRLGGVKRRLAAVLRPSAAGPEGAYRSLLNFMFKPAQASQVFTPEFLRDSGGFDADAVMTDWLRRCPSADWRDRVLYVDAKTYLPGLLAFEDKVSMTHALETRVPLLDNELVDFLLDVPFELLWRGQVGKFLFRESVRPWVPAAVYGKPKMGFAPPDASWYRGRLRPWIEDLLGPQVRGERGVFQGQHLRTILDAHFSGERNYYYLIWSLINFEMWCRVFGFYGAALAQGSPLAA